MAIGDTHKVLKGFRNLYSNVGTEEVTEDGRTFWKGYCIEKDGRKSYFATIESPEVKKLGPVVLCPGKPTLTFYDTTATDADIAKYQKLKEQIEGKKIGKVCIKNEDFPEKKRDNIVGQEYTVAQDEDFPEKKRDNIVGQEYTVAQDEDFPEKKRDNIVGQEYTVAQDDTLYGIAEKLLGSGPAWHILAEYNGLDRETGMINPGETLGIPSTRLHEVQEGDTLFGISEKYLGEGSLWTEIAKANGLDTATGMIHPGQKIVLPGKKETE